MSSPPPETIYNQDYPNFPLLRTASVADFLFSSPHAALDDSTAFIDSVSGLTISRKEMKELAMQLAKGVQGLELKRGKGVGMIFSPNSIAWPIVFFGLLSSSITTTLANSSYTPTELAHQLSDSRTSLIFVAPSLFPVLLETLKLLKYSHTEMKKRVVIMSWTKEDEKAEKEGAIGKEWMRLRDVVRMGGDGLSEPVKLSEKETDETTLLCYSSGTTGLSKGVETTHRNVVTLLQIYHPIAPKIDRSKDVEIGLLPLYHIFGIIKVLLYSFWIGTPVVLLPKFEPLSFFRTVQTYRVSIMKLVPPVLVVLATHPSLESGKYDLSSMRFLMCGAAPLGEGLVRRVMKRFESRGWGSVNIIQGYGLTETSPTAICMSEEEGMRKIGSVGRLMPCIEARLVDEDGHDVRRDVLTGTSPPEHSASPTTGPGELWFRGPSVMKGYLNNPTATKNSITPDGWFKTGDIAVRDNDGYYWIVDRKKELIKYKGFQVPPADLEAVLLTKDDVADVGVIGVESKEQATELPRAYVVPTNPKILTSPSQKSKYEKQVEEWIKTKVAKHKFLRGGVRAVDVIPKSGAGKILRRQLRDLAQAEAKQDLERDLAGTTGGPMSKL